MKYLQIKVDSSGTLDDVQVKSAENATNDSAGNNIENTYAKKSILLDLIFPVGSIYMNYSDNSSPASKLGGTWMRIYDKFLIGAGRSYTFGTEGGEEFHQLTTAEMPSHSHNTQVRLQWVNTPIGNSLKTEWASPTGNLNITSYGPITTEAGGDVPHNNMPPYRAVWMWRRTA